MIKKQEFYEIFLAGKENDFLNQANGASLIKIPSSFTTKSSLI